MFSKKKAGDAYSIVRAAELEYKRLESYRDRGTIIATMNPGEPDEHVTSIEFSTVFKRSVGFSSVLSVDGWIKDERLSFSLWSDSKRIFERDSEGSVWRVRSLGGPEKNDAFAFWEARTVLALLRGSQRLCHPSLGYSSNFEYLGTEQLLGESCHVVIERGIIDPHSLEQKLWISIETNMVRKIRRTKIWKSEYYDPRNEHHLFWRPIQLVLVAYHYHALREYAYKHWYLQDEANMRTRLASTCVIETTYDTVLPNGVPSVFPLP